MSRELEELIAHYAGRQHGVVTHTQLIDAGFSPSLIGRRLRAGRLRPLHRGVYLAASPALPHTREMAAVLASGPGAVLSCLSAAALLGLRGAVRGPVDVSVAGNRGHSPGIRAHRIRCLARTERTVVEGIPVTTAGRTLLDIAALLPTDALEAAVARAERERLVSKKELLGLVARHRGHRGMRALRFVLRRAGGPALTRSAAERRFLALVRGAGLPQPECNAVFRGYEVDFLWREGGIAVEVDGFRYHSSHPSFEQDRRKDAELLVAGFGVLRLSWSRITDEPLAVAAQLGQALGRAAARR